MITNNFVEVLEVRKLTHKNYWVHENVFQTKFGIQFNNLRTKENAAFVEMTTGSQFQDRMKRGARMEMG